MVRVNSNSGGENRFEVKRVGRARRARARAQSEGREHGRRLGRREALVQSFGQLILRLIELIKDANETLLTNT